MVIQDTQDTLVMALQDTLDILVMVIQDTLDILVMVIQDTLVMALQVTQVIPDIFQQLVNLIQIMHTGIQVQVAAGKQKLVQQFILEVMQDILVKEPIL